MQRVHFTPVPSQITLGGTRAQLEHDPKSPMEKGEARAGEEFGQAAWKGRHAAFQRGTGTQVWKKQCR